MSLWPKNRRNLVLPDDKSGKTVCVAFFDADQTLRKTKSGKPSPEGAKDTIIFSECSERLLKLSNKGYVLAIVSNQAGIGLKLISEHLVNEGMQEIMSYFAKKNIYFNYYDFADKYDEFRKPNIGMAILLEKKLNEVGCKIDWNSSFMVGDAAWKRGKDIQPNGEPGGDHSNADRLFAENIAKTHQGFKFYHPKDFF